MTALRPDGDLALNPDVAHPSFSWQVSLPSDPSWSLLDTNPSSWRRSTQRLVDERLAGRHLAAAERRGMLDFVADLVTSCQQAGALLSLVQIGALPSGEFSTAGLHIAWYDSSPDMSSLAVVRSAVAGRGLVEEHDGTAGPVLLHRDVQTMTLPGRALPVRLTALQAFRPIPDRSWTAVVATASAHPTLTNRLHATVLAVAASIEVLDSDPRSFALPHRVITGAPKDLATMRTHRIDGDRPSGEPQP